MEGEGINKCSSPPLRGGAFSTPQRRGGFYPLERGAYTPPSEEVEGVIRH